MASSPATTHELQAHLQIDTPLGTLLGAQRIALLEAIHRHGSISRAAKAVGLSYKAAWDAVDDMNNLSNESLLSSSSGGVRGGGTTLTPYGQRLISFYRALESEYRGAVARLGAALEAAEAEDTGQFQRLLKRFSMQTSARNQFMGTVARVRSDSVEALVELVLGPHLSLAAVVTAESAERMGLRPGAEAYALIKSSSVMLTHLNADQISARNWYKGKVIRVQRGPVNSEVILQLSGTRLQLASVVTDDSVARLGVAVGSELAAFFKASSVSLAVTT